MTFETIHITETESTNRWMACHAADGHDLVVWADYQTAGRGCGSNHWESEHGENLLFSMLIHPEGMNAVAQFRISMAISIAIANTLAARVGEPTDITIKWPNDIYWRRYKMCGILIENSIAGCRVRHSIIGVGLNVNQQRFTSDAPNPVSLAQATGTRHDREALLHDILQAFTLDIDADNYRKRLYRRNGFFPYRDANGDFEAQMCGVDDNGYLMLRDRQGRQRRYGFKEVTYL